MRGRVLEFASLVTFGAVSAFLLVSTISELLDRPLLAIERALVAKEGR